MNSAVITKLEYRFSEADSYSEITYTGFSAHLTETSERKRAGRLHTTTIRFKKPKCTETNDKLFYALENRKAIYRATDANGTSYILGSDLLKASFSFERRVEGKAGQFNGYNCIVRYKSGNGIVVQ